MMLIEEPAVTDGLDTWLAWLDRLNALSVQYHLDESLVDAVNHAEKVIRILRTYPNGLDLRSTPNFDEIIQALAR